MTGRVFKRLFLSDEPISGFSFASVQFCMNLKHFDWCFSWYHFLMSLPNRYLKYLFGVLFHEIPNTHFFTQMAFMLGVTEDRGCVGPHDLALPTDLGFQVMV